ncbi:MAG: metal ABC transporter permease [Deltaproteobacteria bacterium]|jgi:zinc transport system permease protein|nr:metal ABC transporter permease [Deltaproteobacteria bacterium]
MEILASIYDFFGFVYEPVFMRRSALAMALLCLSTSSAGVMVVNRRLAFFPDAVGHSVFAGVAIALLFGFNLQLTVLGLSIVIGLTITFLARHSHLASDTIIGLVFSGAVALGLALVSREPQATSGLSRFFLGDVLTVDDGQVLALFALALLSFLFMFFLTNRLTLACVIPKTKKNTWTDYLFGAYLALVVAISVQAVGVLLVTALLIAPAATGRILSVSLKGMFWLALLAGALAGQLGLWASSQPSINATAGATVVLANVLLFCLASLFRRFFPVR